MNINSIDLKEFYDTIQGKVVQRIIRNYLKDFWPNTLHQRVIGLGYSLPYLKGFIGESERVIALMPSGQGAVFWPPDEKGLVSLCHERELPIESNSVDRIFVIHAVHDFESLDSVLRESWRVLSGQGRLILVVPNRQGLWARFDNTPFGHGVPYSMGQIRHLLKEYMFVPERGEHALFLPPTSSRLMLAMAPVFEKIGHRFMNVFGGVNIVEASKQVYAGTPAGAVNKRMIRRPAIAAAKPMS